MVALKKVVFAMLVEDGTVYDNNNKQIQVFKGEIVKVIQCVGTIAIIRPYNKRSMYSINPKFLNFDITQDERNYTTTFGKRTIKS